MKNWETLKRLIEGKEDFSDYIKEKYKEYYEFPHQVDIYAYINDEETEVTLSEFTNVGGNSWLNDDHFTIYSFKPAYHTLIDDFDSPKEFVDYMIDCYEVSVPFDDYTDEDGNIDYQDCAAYISENCTDEYNKAINAFVDETWDGYIVDAIMEQINDKIEYENSED